VSFSRNIFIFLIDCDEFFRFEFEYQKLCYRTAAEKLKGVSGTHRIKIQGILNTLNHFPLIWKSSKNQQNFGEKRTKHFYIELQKEISKCLFRNMLKLHGVYLIQKNFQKLVTSFKNCF
jgi:hypothetical protein